MIASSPAARRKGGVRRCTIKAHAKNHNRHCERPEGVRQSSLFSPASGVVFTGSPRDLLVARDDAAWVFALDWIATRPSGVRNDGGWFAGVRNEGCGSALVEKRRTLAAVLILQSDRNTTVARVIRIARIERLLVGNPFDAGDTVRRHTHFFKQLAG